MGDKDVINHRLEVLESTARQMGVDKMVMQGKITHLFETVDSLKKYVSDLEKKLSEKVGVTDIKQVVKQSEIIKQINEISSVGMDSAVRISLDGKVMAESFVEQTTDAIKISATDIKGVRTNETI